MPYSWSFTKNGFDDKRWKYERGVANDTYTHIPTGVSVSIPREFIYDEMLRANVSSDEEALIVLAALLKRAVEDQMARTLKPAPKMQQRP